MQKIWLLSSFVLMIISSSNQVNQIHAQGIERQAKYSHISLEEQNSTIDKLNSDDKVVQSETAKLILERPNLYIPPVLYDLSNYLYSIDRKREAAIWFYTAQLRARYDANRCNDQTAAQAVAVLNQHYGPQINKYGFADITNLEFIVYEAIDYVSENLEEYDHQWINLHGMGAFVNEDQELSKPESEWELIKSKTVADYLEGFKEAMNSMKN